LLEWAGLITRAALRDVTRFATNIDAEFGYARACACGVALDNPGLIVACIIGDGEAKTGARLATTKLASSI
jgi:thiamine pyrophosphate-dependent acetolactate synthase large subunit-like protein